MSLGNIKRIPGILTLSSTQYYYQLVKFKYKIRCKATNLFFGQRIRI